MINYTRFLTFGKQDKYRALLIIISLFNMFCLQAQRSLSNETLNYVISYKWGLIHKDAAHATLKLTTSANQYKMTLTAGTLPWADKIFEVRDTLQSSVHKDGFKVISYMKSTHEGGKFARDIINFRYSGNNVIADAKRIKEKKGKISRQTKEMSGIAPAFDMLSLFYYIRLLDFNNMATNKSYSFTIFSGTKTETVKIKKLGLRTITMRDKKQRSAYQLSFTFTSGSKKKSSDDILAYISADGKNIPLYIVGKLPIGEVRVYLL